MAKGESRFKFPISDSNFEPEKKYATFEAEFVLYVFIGKKMCVFSKYCSVRTKRFIYLFNKKKCVSFDFLLQNSL